MKRFLKPRVFFILFLVALAGGGIWYWQLSNRHKAIVKTKLLHAFRIIDHDWEVAHQLDVVKLESPDLLVDNIYQSMDGPQAMINVNVNPGNELKWITGFKAEVFKEGTNVHNNDFLCHTNIDFYDAVHYGNLNIPARIRRQYPRLGTLSNGINQLSFPEGFGFPVAADDKLLVASRTLNHNIEDAFFKVKHHIEFAVSEDDNKMKPLVPKALVLLRDYDRENPYAETSSDPNLCTPIDLKNHSFPNAEGVKLSSHWILPEGKQRYEFEITYQLGLGEDTTIHAMTAHLHPRAEIFTLYDITDDKAVHTITCENYTEKIGLKDVPAFSSVEGIPIKKDHRYKLILETSNPSSGFSDMMAVLFIYIYDAEMDRHLRG